MTTDHSASLRSLTRSLFGAWGVAIAACLGFAAATHGHGAIDERIAALQAQIAASSRDAGLHFQLAQTLAEHEDWPAARQALARVEELAPGKFPIDLVRGRIELAAGLSADALAALDRFLAANPGEPRALLLRARANEMLGKNEACLADYRATLAADAHPEPDLFQEVAEALAFRGHEDAALAVLAQGLERLGTVPSLEFEALKIETAAKRFDAAISRVDVLQKTAPRPEPWMAKRAALLDQAGRRIEARSAWQALASRLAGLPAGERGSHAMSILAEQAQQALRRLSSSTSISALP